MKKTFTSLLLLVASALLSVGALAEKADSNKPMNIEADALRYDDLNQTSVFTGRVVITKGTIIIRGARVDVRQDPEGYQYATVTAEPGKLAYYRQKREGVDEYIEGESESIEYDSKADIVKFIKRAVLRRYTGATLTDETTGELITYNNSTDVFTVDGTVTNPTGGVAGGPTRTRVRAMLTPRNAASAPAGTAPTTPPAGALPKPALRPSTTLGGEPK
ncbi:MAG: lipopolysaccharide transport periplasmic protein LptA [Rhodoferax sp.]|nr:lipopolysaccharide transport periplasmic protein LptA [Rhodoferax sp.]